VIRQLGLELVLGVAVLFAGTTFWQLHKREKFLQRTIREPKSLRPPLSLHTLSDPPAQVAIFAQKSEMGYPLNIKVVIEADRRSQRYPKLISVTVLVFLLAASYFLGAVFLVVNSLLFLLLSLGGLTQSARLNASQQVLALAVILYRWRTEDPVRCDEWVQKAPSLHPLYEAVRAAR
jgi:hypothetical protein